MPKMEDMVNKQIAGSSFSYSAVKPEILEATEYTLVNVVVDVSGSVHSFATELREAIETIVMSCKKNPRVENILVRLVTFNHDVTEMLGFTPVGDIRDIGDIKPNGMTALFDAVYSAIGSTVDYAKILIEDHYMEVNAVNFVITDGDDTSSSMDVQAISNKVEEIKVSEELSGSITTVLIGINDNRCKDYLNDFKDKAGLDQYISVGDADANSLAKLAGFISQSISSVSQSLSTGDAVSLTF